MSLIERDASRKRIFAVLACFGTVIFLTNLALITGTDFGLRIEKLPLPEMLGGKPKGSGSVDFSDTLPKLSEILDDLDFDRSRESVDNHPIVTLMTEATQRFREYDTGRSKTFSQAVKRYRSQYGRHPPPDFDKWYIFARERGIYHLDDFDQIMADLRPFFSIPPADLRLLIRGIISEDSGPSGLAAFSIKSGKVSTINSKDNWRAQNFEKLLNVFAPHLPDMEIAMNRLDQPRVIVEWETLQDALRKEESTRSMPPEVINEFTPRAPISDSVELPTAEWFRAPGKPYMDLASKACPPESYARNNDTMDPAVAEAKYKLPNSGGLVTNFNLSSDLCTVGPAITDLHGFMFSASTIVATKKLVPVFGECKVNVNNDILFPANMYYAQDPRYDYNGKKDTIWEDKQTTMFWRGITSGGVQTKDNWRRLHRHRLVLMTNSTALAISKETHPILNWTNDTSKTYTEAPFAPPAFAQEYTDVGFSEMKWCVPDPECEWLKTYFSEVPQTALTDQFQYKYLVDIDGHSFSGRWHAFLKSRSVGIKATVFREWHDSRLFAWLHFAPMDNRFDDLYTLLTYFIGLGSPHGTGSSPGPRTDLYVPGHDFEAKKLANQGREWAGKVLRREDIEIYMYRLMLEYARLLDDERDRIGYGGDGSEMDEKWSW